MTLDTDVSQTDILLEQLDDRLTRVEQMTRRMRLAKATLLRLKPGDILAIRVPRPLASSEREQITKAFAELMASLGHAHDIKVAVICGMDAVDLDVIRPEAMTEDVLERYP